MLIKSISENQTRKEGYKFASELKGENVIALFGELGSGKTQFVKGICDFFSVKEVVNSPTFIILNEYTAEGKFKISHIDLYRLKNQNEFIELGFKELFNGDNLVLIEWAERIESLLPENAVKIFFKHGDSGESERIIDINN